MSIQENFRDGINILEKMFIHILNENQVLFLSLSRSLALSLSLSLIFWLVPT